MGIIRLFVFIIPLFSYSQLFTIENNYMEMYNLSSINNFSENTYLNHSQDITVSYQIITDSMPPEWDFQNCFPECHPINTSTIDPIAFVGDSSVFLKGHFYPNNVPGEGLLVMELNANHGLHLDTVTWRGTALLETDVAEYLNDSRGIKYITNLEGRRISEIKSESVVIITYQNNQSKVCYIIK